MRRAVITGAKSGLGEAIFVALSKSGFHCVDWSTPVVDVSNERVVQAAAKGLLPIDLLVNNAGVNELDWTDEMRLEDFQYAFKTNVDGIFNCSRYLLPQLKNQGTILNITSAAANIPMTCSLAYNASKAAANMMTRQMAREFYPRHGVTVFGVAPSKIAGTAMTEYIDREVPRLRGWSEEEAKSYSLKNTSIGKDIPAELIAEFIGFLVSKKERHEYLNGCIIPYGI